MILQGWSVSLFHASVILGGTVRWSTGASRPDRPGARRGRRARRSWRSRGDAGFIASVLQAGMIKAAPLPSLGQTAPRCRSRPCADRGERWGGCRAWPSGGCSTASLSPSPAVPAFQVDGDEFALAQGAGTRMRGGMVGKVRPVVGRTYHAQPAAADLRGGRARAGHALVHAQSSRIRAGQDGFQNITQEHRPSLPRARWVESRRHSATRCAGPAPTS